MTKAVEMDTVRSNQGINDNDRHYEVWMIAQQNLRRKRGMWDKKMEPVKVVVRKTDNRKILIISKESGNSRTSGSHFDVISDNGKQVFESINYVDIEAAFNSKCRVHAGDNSAA